MSVCVCECMYECVCGCVWVGACVKKVCFLYRGSQLRRRCDILSTPMLVNATYEKTRKQTSSSFSELRVDKKVFTDLEAKKPEGPLRRLFKAGSKLPQLR